MLPPTPHRERPQRRSTLTGEMVNIEMSPGRLASVLRVDSYSYHFNQVRACRNSRGPAHPAPLSLSLSLSLSLFLSLTAGQYLRLNVSHFPDPSSDHRLARIKQLPVPQSAAGERDWARACGLNESRAGCAL